MSGADLVDLLPYAVIQLDATRRVVAGNAAVQTITGYRPSELVGRQWPEVVNGRSGQAAEHGRPDWHRSVRLRSVRSLPEQALVIRTRSGRDAVVRVAGTYQRDAGGVLVGAVLVLRSAGHGADQHHGLEIVSMVGHELRSPLTSVKGFTRLLLNSWSDFTDDQKKAMLSRVNHDADRVTRLINELLDISRLESGGLTLRLQPVDLPELAGEVTTRIGLEYPDLDARIDFPDAFPKAYADPDKVERVLSNLVENACKYASPRGLRIAGAADSREVSVTVTDQGEGIPSSDLAKVFTKFFRRYEGRPHGSGLGLWISRGLVEAHGGRLVAESIAGQGTAFRFTLPLRNSKDMHHP
jgi:PAS domain S-box-containing protein